MTRSFCFVVSSVAAMIATAPAFAAVGDIRAVVGTAAVLRTDPPDLKTTTDRIPFGSSVEILEEKTVKKDRFAKVKLTSTGKTLGWVKVEGNLGSPKEFDATMKPSDAIAIKGLKGLDLTMASMYNARGKYLKEQATKLGVAASDLAAVLLVESRGQGFDESGDIITRFENHVFYKRWGKAHEKVYDQHFTFDKTPKQNHKGHTFRKGTTGDFTAFHNNNAKELDVLAFARTLDDTAALESASYGAAQVMGFNFATLGYSNVQDMVKDFGTGIRPQLDGMIAYIKGTKACMDGLKKKDYVKFARGYNGSGKEVEYGEKIKNAAESYARVAKGMKFAD